MSDLPDVSDSAGLQVNKTPLWRELLVSINKLEMELDNYSVVIASTGRDSIKTIAGTIISLKGWTKDKKLLQHSYVISKSSEVGSNAMTTLHNKRTAARVIYRDDERDLVLLELDAKSDFSVAVSDIQSGTVRADELGKLLISTNPLNEGKISVLGTTGFTLPAVYSIGYLGMRLEDGKNVIASVQPNTAADKAGLKAGDVILDINRIQVENSTAFVKELKNKRPYEVISVVRVRDNKRDTLDITLQSRPFQGINHLAEEFTDGRSERRDGFGNVFIHDAKLKPSECGGPVFDLNKKMMGINIARYSRTSSLGIPGKEVIEFLKSAFSKK